MDGIKKSENTALGFRVKQCICKYRWDILSALGVGIASFLIAYVYCGFAKYGLALPYNYGGGDENAELVITKLLGEEFWNWYNPRLGAPFGNYACDVFQNYLNGFDLLVAKVLYIFTKDAVVVQNLRFLLIFPISSMIAYGVMRCFKINNILSALGGFIFSMSPYIFLRNISHLGLATCYFIPLSILLCVWASEQNDGYLKFQKGFFKNKRNIAAIIFAALIANNGFAYYAFFTCFFLCVVAVCNLVNTKKLKSVAAPLKSVGFIAMFLFIAVLPALVTKAIIGGNPEAVGRSIADAELYSLKIVQMFIPIDGNGVEFLNRIIYKYNSSMPLVNENVGVYLGIAGICGFLLSIIYLFKYNHRGADDNISEPTGILVRLNVFAVLFGTIGGFSSIVGIMIGGVIRGFNRIAIYILFISLCLLLLALQSAWDRIKKQVRWKKLIYCGALAVFFYVCVWDLVPMYGARDSAWETIKASYESDGKFVDEMEAQLDDGAMVFQLPYHKCPEAGPVNNMADYNHYIGYIHSDTIKWSYGGTRGREADIWCEYAASLEMPEMIDFIARGGFSAIYIDARAYTADKLSVLKKEIEDVIGISPFVSDNGNLLFYNLKGYISSNNISVDESVYDIDRIKTRKNFNVGALSVSVNGEKNDDEIVLNNGSVQYGPYCRMEQGEYLVAYYGENLTKASFNITCDSGAAAVPYEEYLREDGVVILRIRLEKELNAIEFTTFNSTNEIIKVKCIKTIMVRNESELLTAKEELLG